MTVTKDILNAGLAAQSAGLALSNLKKRKKRRVIGQGVTNLLGVSMLKAEADIFGGFD